MVRFFVDNWLALISLVIALSGGIPGLLAFVEHRRKRVKLGIQPVGTTAGRATVADGSTRTMLMFTLTVTNSGERPLVPIAFSAAIMWHGHWLALEPQLIPEGAEFASDSQQITVREPHKADLQRLAEPITEAKPALGHLMFFTGAFSLDEYRAALQPSIRIRCHDIFGKTHTVTLPPADGSMVQGATFPKHGVAVAAKPIRSMRAIVQGAPRRR